MGNLLLPTGVLAEPAVVLRAADQDPADRRLHRLTAATLGVAGDLIEAIFVQVPADLTIVVIRFRSDAVSFWVSDGLPDTDYPVGLLISLASGARHHVQLVIPVRALAPALPLASGHPILPPTVPNGDPPSNPVLVGDSLVSLRGKTVVIGV